MTSSNICTRCMPQANTYTGNISTSNNYFHTVFSQSTLIEHPVVHIEVNTCKDNRIFKIETLRYWSGHAAISYTTKNCTHPYTHACATDTHAHTKHYT